MELRDQENKPIGVSVILPVYISEPWTEHLTRFAIRMLRDCTSMPFELIIVEVKSDMFKELADVHIKVTEQNKYYQDFNRGIEAATGTLIVHTGNDVIMQPGWLEALVRPWTIYPDCGISSLAAAEGGGIVIGPRQPMDLIVETFYAPIMMFQKDWRFDEQYLGQYGDSDLVMRIYASGKRAYMNCQVVVYHFHGATSRHSLTSERVQQDNEVGKRLFYERWGRSPYLLTRLILRGGVSWGKEHEV